MKGLNKLYFLKIEIEELKEEIKSLETLKSPVISDMPHSATTSNPVEQYFIKKQQIKMKAEFMRL